MNQPIKTLRSAALAAVALLAMSALTACGASTPTGEAGEEPIMIAFIGESSSTDVIWSYRADRMREEAEELGAEFVDRYAEGDYALQAQMIDEEVARGVDAIIAPFFDPTVANDAILNALEQGVAVYALLGAPDLPEADMAKIAVALTDWGDVGAELASVAADYVDDGDTVVWPAEAPDGTYITDAVAAFKEEMAGEGKTVTVDVIDATGDPTTASSNILSYLVANPEVSALATSGAIAIGAANTAMTQGNLDAGRPPLFGQVVNPSSSNGILTDYMPAGVNLELTESSYEAVRSVVDMVKTREVPAPVNVPLIVVTKDNLEEVVPEALRD